MPTYAGAYPSKPTWQLQLDVTEGTLDPANNRSYVSWGLYIYRGNSDTPYNNSSTSWSVSGPGGTSGAFGAFRFGGTGSGTNYSSTPVGGRVLIASSGGWVTHNADGSKSISVSASHAAASTLGTATLSGTITLTTLPRNRAKVGKDDEWKLAETYVGVNGEWKPAQLYAGVDGTWKQVATT